MAGGLRCWICIRSSLGDIAQHLLDESACQTGQEVAVDVLLTFLGCA